MRHTREKKTNLVIISVSLAREKVRKGKWIVWAEGQNEGRERSENGQWRGGNSVRVPVGPSGPPAPPGCFQALLAPLRCSSLRVGWSVREIPVARAQVPPQLHPCLKASYF